MLVQDLIKNPYKLVFIETDSNILTEEEFNNIIDILKYFKSVNKLDKIYSHYDNYNLINITHLIESYDFLTVSISNANYNQLIVYLSNIETVMPIYRKLDIVTEAEGGTNIWLLPLTIKTNELLYYNEVDFEVVANNNIKPAVFMLNGKILQTVTETDASSLQAIYSSPFYTLTGYITDTGQFVQVVKKSDDGVPIPDRRISVYSSDLFRYLIIYSTEAQKISLDYNLAITIPEIIDSLPYDYELTKGINLIDFGNTIATKWKTPLDTRLTTDLYYFQPYTESDSITVDLYQQCKSFFLDSDPIILEKTYNGFLLVNIPKGKSFSVNERLTTMNQYRGQYYSRTQRAALNSFDLSAYGGNDPYINFTNVANTFFSGYSIEHSTQNSDFFIIPIGRINRHMCEGFKLVNPLNVNSPGTYFTSSQSSENFVPFIFATDFQDKWFINPQIYGAESDFYNYNNINNRFEKVLQPFNCNYLLSQPKKKIISSATAQFRLGSNTSLSSSWESIGFFNLNSFAPWEIPTFYEFVNQPPGFDPNKLREYRYNYVGPVDFTYEKDIFFYLGDVDFYNLSTFTQAKRSRNHFPPPVSQVDLGDLNIYFQYLTRVVSGDFGENSYITSSNGGVRFQISFEQIIYDSAFEEFFYSSTGEFDTQTVVPNNFRRFTQYDSAFPLTQLNTKPRSSYLHSIGYGMYVRNGFNGVKFRATWTDNRFDVEPITVNTMSTIYEEFEFRDFAEQGNVTPIFYNYQLSPQCNRGLIPAVNYSTFTYQSWNGLMAGTNCRLLFPADNEVRLNEMGIDVNTAHKFYFDLSDQNHRYGIASEDGMFWNAIRHLMTIYIIPIDEYQIVNGKPLIDYDVEGAYNLNQLIDASNLGYRSIKFIPVLKFKTSGGIQTLFNSGVPDNVYAQRLFARLRAYVLYLNPDDFNIFFSLTAENGIQNDFPVISNDKYKLQDALMSTTLNLWDENNFQWFQLTSGSNSPVKCGAGYTFQKFDDILVSNEELNEGKPVYTYLDPLLSSLQTLEVIDVLSRAIDLDNNVFTVNHTTFDTILLYPGTSAIRHFALVTPHSFPNTTYFIDRLVRWHQRLQELSDQNGIRGYLYHTTDPTANKPSIMIGQEGSPTISSVFAAKEFICGNSFVNKIDWQDRLNDSHWIMKPIIKKPLEFNNYDLKKFDWSITNRTWNYLYQENLSNVGIYSAYGLRKTIINENDFVGFGTDSLREAITLPSNIPGFDLSYHYELFYFSSRVILFEQIKWISTPFNGITTNCFASDSFILPDWLTTNRSFYLDIVYKDRKTAAVQLYTDAYLINGIYPLSYISNTHQTEYFINTKLQYLSRFFIVTEENTQDLKILLAFI